MGDLIKDIRHSFRALLKRPGFSIVTVLTLALALGANVVTFNMVNAFFLRPLPVKDADRLIALASQQEGHAELQDVSYLDYQDYRAQSDVVTDMCGYEITLAGLSYQGHADRLAVSYVTGNYFSMLGVQPLLGRLIRPGEGEKFGADPYVVLGYSYWKRRFGGDPSIVGQTVNVNGRPFTVIGVVPKKFQGTFFLVEMDAYMPLGMIDTSGPLSPTNPLARRTRRNLRVLASLKPGITLKQAQTSFQLIARRLGENYPAEDKDEIARVFWERQARPEPTTDNTGELTAIIFMVLVGMVLLVACINIANIQLVRATVRQKELAVRAALGAGRWRLVREVLVENLLLAAAGSVGGLLVGAWISSLFRSLPILGDFPIALDFAFDWRVFAFAAVIAFGAGVFVSLLPSVRVSRTDLNTALREGGRGSTEGGGHHRLRNMLVVTQVAGSLIILVSTGLFLRSLRKAQTTDLGYQPQGVLDINLSLPPRYDEVKGAAFYRELKRRVQQLPGVESATVAFCMPMGYYNSFARVAPEGQVIPLEKQLAVIYNRVDPDYFSTLRIRLLAGRAFLETDTPTSERVAIVNEFMARHLWPGQDPIGRHFTYQGSKGPIVATVVGVVGNGKFTALYDDPQSYFFVPLTQSYSELVVLQIRTRVPPQALELPVQREIAALDSDIPVFDVQTFEQTLDGVNGFFLLRVGTGFAAALGLLGLLLAVVGVYGVVSYAASQRTHEIGIRIALGAQQSNILSLVFKQGLGLVLIGIGIGLAVSWGVMRFTATLLFGIRPTDPLTFSLVAILVAAVALLACHIPARRASKLDPMSALRIE